MRIVSRTQSLFFVVCISVVLTAQTVPEPLPEQTPPPKKSMLAPLLTIGALGVAGGLGGYFIYRNRRREGARADSVITLVERAWDRAAQLYAQEQYRAAIKSLQEITGAWYDYNRYGVKYRRRLHVSPDSIRSVIASCDFLEKMIPLVRTLSDRAELLPEDEYTLSQHSRHDLAEQEKYLRTSLDSIITTNPNHRMALRYSFRHIERRLQTVDSLVDAAYLQQQANFSLKNRFYYNRAIESNDTTMLRRFVDDCDYYRVEKEWCQRARMALGATTPPVSADGGLPKKKMSVKDSIVSMFDQVIGSRKIEALDRYIKKYSSRRYRRYRRYIRLTEIKAAQRQLRTEIDMQMALNKAYPRLAAGNVDKIVLTVKGLSQTTENIFNEVWSGLAREKARLPQVRLPMSLQIDYTTDPPVIQVEAVIDPMSDVEQIAVNELPAYSIECLLPLVALLNTLKKEVVRTVQQEALEDTEEQVKQFQIKKVAYAVYAVRLRRPGDYGMIMIYAKESRHTARGIAFYEFYDISVSGFKTARFPIYPTSFPNIIPSIASDSLEQQMGERFFSSK